MITQDLQISQSDCRKLLSAASPDAALLYIYLYSGNPFDGAETALGLNRSRLSCAGATLRQLGLWPEEKVSRVLAGERPVYTEEDVIRAMDTDSDFRGIKGEVERVLGRILANEELKILLGFSNYLGLSNEVISMLISYCRNRQRQRGSLRSPSLRSIEKEAYFWAEHGIDTVEEAAAFIQTQNARNSRLAHLMRQLQIRGRALTAAEEKYAQSWLDMNFDEECISMAYERTCLNTGGLNWAYMNRILQRWHQQGLHTAQEVRSGDQKAPARGASGQRQFDEDEMASIQRLMQEA